MVVILLSALLVGALGAGLAAGVWQEERQQKARRVSLRGRLGVLDGDVAQAEGGGFCAVRSVFSQTRKAAEGRRIKASYARDFPAMLDVIALGLRAGMGFDQSFELYVRRFKTPLATISLEAFEVWQRGLVSREVGLRELAQRVDSPFFTRFCSTTLRAIRFGAPMTELLIDLAQEARREYRALQQEKVAKAPVKMLLPTGALILPAMLLLVMGPIVLDLMERMV